MYRLTLVLVALLPIGILVGCEEKADVGPERLRPSLEDIVAFPRLTGTAPSEPRWSRDSEYLAFLWNDHGMPYRDIWVASPETEAPRRLTHLAPDSDQVPPRPEAGNLESLKARISERAQPGVVDLAWAPDSESIYFSHGRALKQVGLSDGRVQVVHQADATPSQLSYSPDGSRLVFRVKGDLWLYDSKNQEASKLTDIAEPGPGSVGIGAFVRPDRYVAGFEWSPDGEVLALELVDQRQVRKVPFPSYLHEEPILHEVRRPYPGDRDLIRQMALLDLETRQIHEIPLAGEDRRLNLEYAWSPDAEHLLLMQGADVAEDRWLFRVSRSGERIDTLLHDHRPKRIYPLFRAIWSKDGDAIYFVSDHEDYYRLYSLPAVQGADQIAPRRLTGAYDVAGERGPAWLAVSPDGDLLYTASKDSPYERHVYRLSAESGESERLTVMPGIHEPSLSPDGRYLALISSNDVTPAELYLLSTDGQGVEQPLTHSPRPEFGDYDWLAPRYVSFPSRDGEFEIHARIVEPANMQPGKQYPVIIGNIYSNTVRNVWQSDRPTSSLQQQMALSGDYISVQVDVRGSVGYGVAFREAFQGDWGRGDLEDLHAAVDYLKTLSYVDPDRIGVWGNSYGGLMVLSALFRKPGLFAAGVAGAPAADVRHFTGFDQHLTRRPETHPGIFQEGSLLNLGEDLVDPLLIIHGLHDDIVPLKTTLMLAEKLMLLGKEFELDIVHDSGHWWAGREHYAIYTFRRLVDYFHRHMPPGGRDKD